MLFNLNYSLYSLHSRWLHRWCNSSCEAQLSSGSEKPDTNRKRESSSVRFCSRAFKRIRRRRFSSTPKQSVEGVALRNARGRSLSRRLLWQLCRLRPSALPLLRSDPLSPCFLFLRQDPRRNGSRSSSSLHRFSSPKRRRRAAGRNLESVAVVSLRFSAITAGASECVHHVCF